MHNGKYVGGRVSEMVIEGQIRRSLFGSAFLGGAVLCDGFIRRATRSVNHQQRFRGGTCSIHYDTWQQHCYYHWGATRTHITLHAQEL